MNSEDPVMRTRTGTAIWAVVVVASLGLHAVAFGGLGRARGWLRAERSRRGRRRWSRCRWPSPPPPPPPEPPKAGGEAGSAAGDGATGAMARPMAPRTSAPPPSAAPPPVIWCSTPTSAGLVVERAMTLRPSTMLSPARTNAAICRVKCRISTGLTFFLRPNSRCSSDERSDTDRTSRLASSSLRRASVSSVASI